MRCYLVLVVVFIAGVANGYSTGRIVGGDPTTIEQYPGIVQVDAMGVFSQVWGQSCAANIISSTYVVSAAHCFVGATYDRRNRRIRAGTTQRNSGGFIIYIVREINHPSYGTLGYDGDISLIELVSALPFSHVVQRVPIAPPNSELPDNSPVVHVGWGAVTQGGAASPVLLDVTIYTVNRELCASRYSNINAVVTENMICAGILDEGGKDACQGDSGGPLYHGNVLVGIVSWGLGCANDTFPGVSAAVSPYTNWILETAV